MEGEGVVEVAAWPAKFSIVFGAGLAAVHYVLRIVDTISRRSLSQGAPETAMR